MLISTAAFKSASSSSTGGGGDDGRVICDERVDEDAEEDRFVRLVLASLAVDGVGVPRLVVAGGEKRKSERIVLEG